VKSSASLRLAVAVAVAVACALGAASSAQTPLQVQVDEALPDYRPVRGVSGTIKSVGSDTMNNLMALWGEGFKKVYPNVRIEVEGKGSATAPPALIAGTSNFGPMSREMKASEVDGFEKRDGYAPTELPVAIDMLAVYVNKDCPLELLTLPQVDAIFSKTRRGGLDRALRTWGELGLDGDWASQPISLYGRNSASGTYGFFKKVALFHGDYLETVKEQPGSSTVVQAVASDRFGIGYSGIGYRTTDVKALGLATSLGAEGVAPTPDNAYSGRYPLTRFLYVYVNRAPHRPLDPLRREFVRYVFSKQGQEDVVKDGYLPLRAEMAERVLAGLLAGSPAGTVDAASEGAAK